MTTAFADFDPTTWQDDGLVTRQLPTAKRVFARAKKAFAAVAVATAAAMAVPAAGSGATKWVHYATTLPPASSAEADADVPGAYWPALREAVASLPEAKDADFELDLFI